MSWLKKPIYMLFHICKRYLSHDAPDQLTVRTGTVEVLIDTTSTLAQEFFFPRYADGTPHEAPAISFLEQKLRTDTCFLDIGAYFGTYALVAAKHCSDGSVHAFELNPLLITEINKSMRLNQLVNMKIICAAIWDSDMLIRSFDSDASVDNAAAMSTRQALPMQNGHSIGVPSITIDNYCIQTNIRPQIAKVDVEGCELRVLNGMKETLRHVQTMLLEIHPDEICKLGDTMEDIATLLQSYGFSVSRLFGHRRANEAVELLPCDDVSRITDNCMLVCERHTDQSY